MGFSRRNFLKNSIAATLGSSLLAGRFHALEAAGETGEIFSQSIFSSSRSTWRNWAGNVECRPHQMCRPQNVEDLKLILQNSFRLRMAGSSHSFNDIVRSDDAIVLTDKLDRVVELDVQKKRIRVEGGIKLHKLYEILDDAGLGLQNIGDVDKQSLAGAISTATHGTGLGAGTMSDSNTIAAMSVIDTEGYLHCLTEENTDLAFLRASLGAVGVIYDVTLNLIESRNLHLQTKIMNLNEALEPDHYLKNDHFQFFVLPFTETAYCQLRNRTVRPVSKYKVKNWFNEVFIENILMDLIFRYAKYSPEKIPSIMNSLVKLYEEEESIEKWHESMTSIRKVKFYEIECAVPIERASEALQSVLKTMDIFSKLPGVDQYFAHMPVELRFVKGDKNVALSPTGGEPTCYVAVHSSAQFNGHQKFFSEVERKLRELGGRPHWGKMFFQSPIDRYPRWNEFLNVRKKYDPKEKLVNDFIRRL
jgi:L-gulono-1,4-lactone dehydrogenase